MNQSVMSNGLIQCRTETYSLIIYRACTQNSNLIKHSCIISSAHQLNILPSQFFAIQEKQFKMKSGQCKCNCITFRQYNTMLSLGEKWETFEGERS